jgi:hypothetical protein
MKNIKADDTEEISEDEFPEKIEKKKKTKKEYNNPIILEEQENIEFILLDLKNFEDLNKFKKMRFLSLNTQNIKSIEVNRI